MRKIFLATVSTIAIGSSAALAADLAPMLTKAPPPVTASWTGAYVGLNAGYAWGDVDRTLLPNGFWEDISVPSFKPNGFIGGGQIGYNRQTGSLVLGGEVDFSGISAKSDRSVDPFFVGKGNPTSATFSSHYDWLFTARLRAGVTFAQNWLVYATGGLAVTQAKDSITGSNFFGPGTSATWSDSKTLVGGTIGGGVECAFTPNWSMKVEYLYAKFNDTTPTVTSSNIGPIEPIASFSHDLNIVRAGINYKFGG